MTQITIESAVGAEWRGPHGVDALIIDELDEILQGLEYMGSPAKHTNPITEIDEDIYYINFEGETLIWLVMQLGHGEKCSPELAVRREV